MSELTSLTILEMREGLLKRDFSATELTESHLRRIEETNPVLNSFISITGSVAREQAQAAQKTIDILREKSPLLTGIPVAIKDMLVTKDIETTCASKMLGGFIPPYDATAVAKLKAEGAVIVGKTNLDEFAMGASNENSFYGPVKNPWDLTRVPGGSSGGSAVAVATGQAPAALGTDTGGSIRQPASMSGTCGIKPTYGRVSRYGAVAFASSLDQIGAFARTMEDLAIVTRAISGHDDADSTSMNVPVPDYLAEIKAAQSWGLKGLRVGVPKEFFIPGMDRQVEEQVRDSLKVLASLGAELVEISLPHSELALPAYYILNPAEASSNFARFDGVRYGYRAQNYTSLTDMYERTRAEGFGKEVRRRILVGTYVLSAGYYEAYYQKAQQIRTLVIDDFKAAFANSCDVIAGPVAPTTAFTLGEKTDDPLQMYLADVFTVPLNLAGLPGLSVPCGLDDKKLPIGLQLIGGPFTESKLLQVGAAFAAERKFDWQQIAAKKSFGA